MKNSLLPSLQQLLPIDNNNSYRLNLILSFTVLTIAYFTYFNAYEYPAKLIWDENFYLTDAQRYLSGVMFMEMHPPLGKLLIALGEWIFQSNAFIDNSAMLSVERINTIPEAYSFKGVRFFPVLLSTLSALLFFWILVQISKRPLLSFLFSSLYVFENSLIVQSRAAMLDGPQIFFAFATLLFFIYRLNKQLQGENNTIGHYIILGLLIGLCSSVRYSGLILLILIPFWSYARWNTQIVKPSKIKKLINLCLDSLLCLTAVILVIGCTFYVHINLASKISENTFTTSEQYQQIIEKGEQSTLSNFFPMLYENLLFTKNYNDGIRNYNAYDPSEKGSLASNWPLMHKSIRYLADRNGGGETKYIYLQGNPIIWYAVLLAIIITLSYSIYGTFFIDAITFNKATDKGCDNDFKNHILLTALTSMYFSYLLVFFNMGRVFYLYNYLLPLCFGLLLFFTFFNKLFNNSLKSVNRFFYLLIFIFCIEIFFSYWFFSPLSYYQAISLEDFHQRQWIDYWNLRPLP